MLPTELRDDRRWLLGQCISGSTRQGNPAGVGRGDGCAHGRIGQTLACQYQIDISELVQGQGPTRSGDTMFMTSAQRMPLAPPSPPWHDLEYKDEPRCNAGFSASQNIILSVLSRYRCEHIMCWMRIRPLLGRSVCLFEVPQPACRPTDRLTDLYYLSTT